MSAHRLVVKNFGPIKEADINVTDFMVLTGRQSSGKSTIAKLIYFFRTADSGLEVEIDPNFMLDAQKYSDLMLKIDEQLTRRFGAMFGNTAYNKNTVIIYSYNKDAALKLTVDSDDVLHFANILEFDYKEIAQKLRSNWMGFNTIFIPAGRSIISLLSGQLLSFYSRMDDGQKNTLDLCTRQYIERIFTIQPEFKNGFASLKQFNLPKWKEQEAMLDEAVKFIKDFLQGEYSYNNGNEILRLSNGQAVAVNYMSSGQQESLWLLNILIYYMVKGNKAFFIIEEPESNLFPEWQKKIIEFIALAHNAGNQMLITTHSPYILAAINNIAYASRLREKAEVSVFPKEYNINNLSAYFADNKGNIIDSIDAESGLIDNMLIDEISGELNEQFDALLDIELREEK